jgi:hypothetical protein
VNPEKGFRFLYIAAYGLARLNREYTKYAHQKTVMGILDSDSESSDDDASTGSESSCKWPPKISLLLQKYVGETCLFMGEPAIFGPWGSSPTNYWPAATPMKTKTFYQEALKMRNGKMSISRTAPYSNMSPSKLEILSRNS